MECCLRWLPRLLETKELLGQGTERASELLCAVPVDENEEQQFGAERTRWRSQVAARRSSAGRRCVMAVLGQRWRRPVTVLPLLLVLVVGPPCAADENDLAGKEVNVADDIACGMCSLVAVRYCRHVQTPIRGRCASFPAWPACSVFLATHLVAPLLFFLRRICGPNW